MSDSVTQDRNWRIGRCILLFCTENDKIYTGPPSNLHAHWEKNSSAKLCEFITFFYII